MFIQLYNKERKDNKWAKSLKKNDNNNNRKKIIVKRKKKYKVEFHDNIIIKDKKKNRLKSTQVRISNLQLGLCG